MSSLEKRFFAHWKGNRFGDISGPVLLAVSGGSDSMAMAHLFLHCKLPFGVAHCNFQLRGDEADADEQLVRDWCTTHNVPFFFVRFDTKSKVEEWKKGTQETARILRYEWLETIRKDNGYARIATAHHANDNAETLLMNLFKGTGISGLHAIPHQHGNIIRPLLFASKKDINSYVATAAVQYREDASNATVKYLRNNVRLNIIPVIENAFPNVIDSLNAGIQRFAEAEQLYNKAVTRELKRLLEQRGNDYYIPVRKLAKTPQLNAICYELFKQFGFAPGQLQDVLSLLSAESGHYVSSSTHRVLRNREFLIVTVFDTRETDFVPIDRIPVTMRAGSKRYKFRYSAVPADLTTDASTAYIDVAMLEQPLVLRRWKQGDYFYPLGMDMKKKKISRYLVDKKVPLHEKDDIWVLESNKRIAWVAGHRMDERFKVTATTIEVLVARIG